MKFKWIKFSCLLASLLLLGPAWGGQPVDINEASAETIAESLDGVGMSKARAIVDYRALHGKFKHVDELVNVKGIGLSTVDKNRDYILFTKPAENLAKKNG